MNYYSGFKYNASTTEKIMSELGESIKKFRKEKKNKNGEPWSQLDLSMAIGWENPSTISRIESGKVEPTKDTVLKIADALNLNLYETNALLRIAGFLSKEPELTEDYFRHLQKMLAPGWNRSNHPMVLLQEVPPYVVYWNSLANQLFLMHTNIKPDLIENKVSHIDFLFNEKYGIKNSIVNWEEFSYIVVRNMIAWGALYGENKEFERFLQMWMQYPDFARHFSEIPRDHESPYMTYNIPFIFDHHKFGILQYNISTYVLYQDKRFFVEEFIPMTPEDLAKTTMLLK